MARSQIDLYNLRIWVLLAHLQLVQGNTARANQVLEAVIAWIDTEYGKCGSGIRTDARGPRR